MGRIDWIKDLVVAEQRMEEQGIVELDGLNNQSEMLKTETIDFLRDLRAAFIESCSAFNELKGSQIGQVKIYGISKTVADFMLFRNGYKLIFSMTRPGEIAIILNHVTAHHLATPGAADPGTAMSHDLLQAHWGAFGELKWRFKDSKINLDYLVRYYMTRFVKESLK